MTSSGLHGTAPFPAVLAPLTAPQVGHRHHSVVRQHPAQARHAEPGLQADIEAAAPHGRGWGAEAGGVVE